MGSRARRVASLASPPVILRDSLTAQKMAAIARTLPKSLNVGEQRRLKAALERAAGDYDAFKTLGKAPTPVNVSDHLDAIRTAAHKLEILLSEAAPSLKDVLAIGIGNFSSTSSQQRRGPPLRESIARPLAEVAADELRHLPAAMQFLLHLTGPAPTYDHLQGILDGIVALRRWATSAAALCRKQRPGNLPKNIEQQVLVLALMRIWVEMTDKIPDAKRSIIGEPQGKFVDFAMAAVEGMGVSLSSRAIQSTVRLTA